MIFFLVFVCFITQSLGACLREPVPDPDKPVIKLEVQNWDSAIMNVEVAKIILEERLGYTVEVIPKSENPDWGGLAVGNQHASLETWPTGKEENRHQYEDVLQAVSTYELGLTGRIGWYILNYTQDKYANATKWPSYRDPCKGFTENTDFINAFYWNQTDANSFIDGPLSWTLSNAQIQFNLDLGLKSYFTTDQSHLEATIRRGINTRRDIIFYLWTPHQIFSNHNITRHDEACTEKWNTVSAGAVDCDYAPDRLYKIVWNELEYYAFGAYQLLQNFTLSKRDQLYMLNRFGRGFTHQEAACEWAINNEDLIESWLPQEHFKEYPYVAPIIPDSDNTTLYIIVAVLCFIILLSCLIIVFLSFYKKKDKSRILVEPDYDLIAITPKYKESLEEYSLIWQMKKNSRTKKRLSEWEDLLLTKSTWPFFALALKPFGSDDLEVAQDFMFVCHCKHKSTLFLLELGRHEVENCQYKIIFNFDCKYTYYFLFDEFIKYIQQNGLTIHFSKKKKESTLFREDSLFVKCFRVYSKLLGLKYIWTTFAPLVNEIYNSSVVSPKTQKVQKRTSISLEIDPSKLKADENQFLNMLQLKIFVQKMVSALTDSLDNFPKELSLFLYEIVEIVKESYPGASQIALTALVFLRFLCPALVSPKEYGLLREDQHVGTECHRILVLLSKVLQNLGNLVNFEKEQFMSSLNEVIEVNRDDIENYYQNIMLAAEPEHEGDILDTTTIEVPDKIKTMAIYRLFHQAQSNPDNFRKNLETILPDISISSAFKSFSSTESSKVSKASKL